MTKKLEVSDLVFDYENRKILNYLDFSVNEGEFVSILGPSGCGKIHSFKAAYRSFKGRERSYFSGRTGDKRRYRAFCLYATE